MNKFTLISITLIHSTVQGDAKTTRDRNMVPSGGGDDAIYLIHTISRHSLFVMVEGDEIECGGFYKNITCACLREVPPTHQLSSAENRAFPAPSLPPLEPTPPHHTLGRFLAAQRRCPCVVFSVLGLRAPPSRLEWFVAENRSR